MSAPHSTGPGASWIEAILIGVQVTTMFDLALALALAAASSARAGEARFELPAGARVERWVEGPGGSVAALYFEPLPADPFCGVGLAETMRDLRRVRVFDRDGKRIGGGRVPPVVAIFDAFIQPTGGVVIWGVPDWRGGSLSRDTLLFRVGADGIDRSFRPLKASDLGGVSTLGGALTGVTMGADGSFEVRGSFSSLLGVPRAGVARMRPDGSLEE